MHFDSSFFAQPSNPVSPSYFRAPASRGGRGDTNPHGRGRIERSTRPFGTNIQPPYTNTTPLVRQLQPASTHYPNIEPSQLRVGQHHTYPRRAADPDMKAPRDMYNKCNIRESSDVFKPLSNDEIRANLINGNQSAQYNFDDEN